MFFYFSKLLELSRPRKSYNFKGLQALDLHLTLVHLGFQNIFGPNSKTCTVKVRASCPTVYYKNKFAPRFAKNA